MGAGQSKGELLHQYVQSGNYDAVKALRRDGASLEWFDKEGRTPLILACTRGELLDMATTLLNLGANINAYRPGTQKGFPLHHAAKKGLEKTVTVLLSRGADPLAINDDGQTPLDMARSKGHVSVVRLLEEWLCLFSGMLRELSGLGFLETIAPNLFTKKIWAVVLPTESYPRKAPTYEVAIYQSPKVPQPRTIISLARYEIEEPKFDTADPVLYITDKTSKMKYKYLSENEGDKTQLEKLYKACRGITEAGVLPLAINGLPAAGFQPRNLPQIHPKDLQRNEAPYPTRQPVWQSVSAPLPNTGAEHIPEKLALAMSLDKSIRTATEEGIPLPQDGPNSSRVNDFKELNVLDGSYKGWRLFDPKKQQKEPKERRHGRWEGEQSIDYGWGSTEQGPSRAPNVYSNQEPVAALVTNPSAPPLPDDPVHYAMLDISQSETENLTGPEDMKLLNANITADYKAGKSCVVCWDAPAEGVCIPCGHLAGCMKCLSEIKAKLWGCPVCRERIDQVVKVYMV